MGNWKRAEKEQLKRSRREQLERERKKGGVWIKSGEWNGFCDVPLCGHRIKNGECPLHGRR